MMDRRIVEEFERIVGEGRTLWRPEDLIPYSQDMTENEPHMPDLVLRPSSFEEVREIVVTANRYGIPIVPVVANTNVGGLAIPLRGGIVLDMRDMRSILHVDEESMFAVIEPGVTFQDLKDYLEENHINLTPGYPLAPPNASVLCNCILQGLGNLSLRYGDSSSWVNGLEAILGDGTVIRAGTAALFGEGRYEGWFAKVPLPDLVGLFLGWQGSTGIVTKISVKLWPKPYFRRKFFVPLFDVGSSHMAIMELSRSGAFDDVGLFSWALTRMAFGQYDMERDPNEPIFYLYLDISGNTLEEVRAKERILDLILGSLRRRGFGVDRPIPVEKLISMTKGFSRFSDFPMYLDFLCETEKGGLSWVGTYGPPRNWSEAMRKGMELMEGMDVPPAVVSRSMEMDHYRVLRFLHIFGKADEEERSKARRLNEDLLQICLENGFVPYKAPLWAVEKLKEMLDPGFRSLMDSIKRLMDPKGIMNPGRW